MSDIQQQINLASLQHNPLSMKVPNKNVLNSDVVEPIPVNRRNLTDIPVVSQVNTQLKSCAPKWNDFLDGFTSNNSTICLKIITTFLLEEINAVNLFVVLNEVAIQPMIDSSKGAELQVGISFTLDRQRRTSSNSELFEKKGSYLSVLSNVSNRITNQSITSQLKDDPDMQLFLRSIENICLNYCEVLTLYDQIISSFITIKSSSSSLNNNNNNNDSKIKIGHIFTSSQADRLFQQLVLYSNGYQAALRIINSPLFETFKAEVDEKLHPNRINDIVQMILNIPNRFFSLLNTLNGTLSKQHSDYQSIQVSLKRVESVISDILKIMGEKANYERILSIYNNFLIGFIEVDPMLETLVNNERVFIREGDLTKICRKSNQVFRFWLFNDILIYGQLLPAGKYKWSRGMNLLSITVQKHISEFFPHAFEILGAEKSFVVMTPNPHELESWMNSIQQTADQYRLKQGVTLATNTNETKIQAAIWIPDSIGVNCCVCNSVSYFFLNFIFF